MSEQLTVHKADEKYTVLELSGRLVPGGEPEISDLLRSTVEGLCDEGRNKILIDLRNVDYMASNAIGALMTLYNTVMLSDGKLVLWRPKKYLSDSLKLVRVDKLLTICDDFDDALGMLGVS